MTFIDGQPKRSDYTAIAISAIVSTPPFSTILQFCVPFIFENQNFESCILD
ncbi:hypothetical protein BofuT4_uP117710.1 [Botrytis cinerea T4]|uniref:Uncharacterized protein n=1 Tax=Botryotinia fuckeliana (strain T4) TaxID=999810 RepID=G2Y0Q6_BOTF4|nr:hypothetical protein BofuT4_uP117710.1 [Botrytis cinerea T4]